MNNKGFAITGVLYGILILFLTLLSLILFSLQGKKTILDKQKKDVFNKLEGIVEINGNTNITYVAPKEGDTHKGIVYMDPTDLTKTCTEADVANNVNSNGTPTEIKTGCMKWYVYNDSGSKYKMILDHNTTSRIKWNDDNINVAYENSNLKPVVDDLVATSKWKLNPRLITATEVNTITGIENFSLSTSGWYYLDTKTRDIASFDSTTRSKYAWLYNNLNNCKSDSTDYGCTIEDGYSYAGYGISSSGKMAAYWTSDTVGEAGSGTLVWRVVRTNRLNTGEANATTYGIRPTVELPKSYTKESNASKSNITYVAPKEGDTHKGIVYLDPTDLTKTCNPSNSVSTTGTKTGCMKWYIFDDSDNKYIMILDHNTTAKVAYETTMSYKPYEQASIKTQVDEDTAGWASGLNPRLITLDEIVSITNPTSFDANVNSWYCFSKSQTCTSNSHTVLSQGSNEYAWLFDYTDCDGFGCNVVDNSTYGYWTSSPTTFDQFDHAWRVNSGILSGDWAPHDTNAGARPVIELEKSYIDESTQPEVQEPVASIGDTVYYSLKSAYDAVPTDGKAKTIKILKNIDAKHAEPIESVSGKNITYDLNGKDVYLSKFYMVGGTAVITGEGTLYIKSEYAVKTPLNSLMVIYDNSKAVIDANAVVSCSKGIAIDLFNSELQINKGSYTTNDVTLISGSGTLVINGGTFTTNGKNNSVIGMGSRGSLTINDGTFIAGGTSNFNLNISCPTTIKGGTFRNNDYSKSLIYTSGDTTIDGGTFTNSSYSWSLINNQPFSANNDKVLVINGGTFNNSANSTSLISNAEDASVIIKNGTFNNESTKSPLIYNGGTVSISNGIFTEKLSNLINNQGEKLTISGGTFTHKSNDYPLIFNGVDKVVDLKGGTYNNVGKSTLLDNSGLVTIEGIKFSNSETTRHTIQNSSTGNITIKSGTFTNSSTDYQMIYNEGAFSIANSTFTNNGKKNLIDNHGTLTIESSTFDNSSTAQNLIYNSSNGTATINSGTFTNKSNWPLLYNNGSFTITNGTFTDTYANLINNNEGTFTTSGGTFKSSASYPMVYTKSTYNLNGGSYTMNGTSCAFAVEGGTLYIRGGSIAINNTTDYTVYNNGGSVSWTGGTIGGPSPRSGW